MNILIMGPAGSGKGTMSKLLIEKYNIAHISTGDMLRENVKKGTELGKKAEVFMNSGRLVPDNLIMQMIKNRIQEKDTVNGYLLDGFPRTLVQAKAFEEIAKEIKKPVDVVINLKVDVDTLVSRVTGRRTCTNCKAIYHIKNNPPKVEGICDICGHELITRKDDTLQQLTIRLKEHSENTEPVLDYYREKNIVCDIDGSKSVEEVWDLVETAIDAII